MFADLARFTALTEAHGDQDAAVLVADFCRAVRAELPASGGGEVKTLGDALMLAIPAPEPIMLGLRITHELMREHGTPAVRVGVHHVRPWRRGRLLRLGGQPRGAGMSGEAIGGARARSRGGCSTSCAAAASCATCVSPSSSSRPSRRRGEHAAGPGLPHGG